MVKCLDRTNHVTQYKKLEHKTCVNYSVRQTVFLSVHQCGYKRPYSHESISIWQMRLKKIYTLYLILRDIILLLIIVVTCHDRRVFRTTLIMTIL